MTRRKMIVLLALMVLLCLPVCGLAQVHKMPDSDTWETRNQDLMENATESFAYLTIWEDGMDNQMNIIK